MTETITQQTSEGQSYPINLRKKKANFIQDFFKAGVQYGHSPKEWNPKMAPYILYERYGYHILDVVKTLKFLKLAGSVLEKKVRKGKSILFVGTTKMASASVAKYAQKTNCFYINYRWLGGMLTNWATLQKRINRLKELEIYQSNPNIQKLSKKAYNSQRKELEKLQKFFKGIKNMQKLPDIVIFTNQLKEKLAIEECKKLGIPVICLVDSNCSPDLIPYPIPANDDSASSIDTILSYLADSILQASNKKTIMKKKAAIKKTISSKNLINKKSKKTKNKAV